MRGGSQGTGDVRGAGSRPSMLHVEERRPLLRRRGRGERAKHPRGTQIKATNAKKKTWFIALSRLHPGNSFATSASAWAPRLSSSASASWNGRTRVVSSTVFGRLHLTSSATKIRAGRIMPRKGPPKQEKKKKK